ncbi:MAG: antitoxin family protein [Chloroflexota bacterium]|nr:antitoxin family protein [Chloroflexota bacterium]
MTQTVRAVYHDGQLKLLDPAGLQEGQIVTLTITAATSPREVTREEVTARLRAAGLLVEGKDAIDKSIDMASLRELTPEERDRIGRLLAADRPVENIISEDRGEY